MPSQLWASGKSPRQTHFSPSSVVLTVLTALFLLGCRPDDQIIQYQVPKSPKSAQAEPTDRMLAAIVIRDKQVWFFKVTSDIDLISPHVEDFREFVRSVDFDGAVPTWDLPKNWQQQPGSGMRFAALTFGDEQHPIELTVIPLPLPPGEERAYLLSNVNRWRREMRLDPIPQSGLNDALEEFEIPAGKISLVDLSGWFSGSARPMGLLGGDRQADPRQKNPAGPIGRPAPIDYEISKDWEELPATGMRAAAFVVTDGEQSAEITVIPLAGHAGDLLSNVNRWRGQIGLDQIDASGLDNLSSSIGVGGVAGSYVELVGDTAAGEAIFGVSAVKAGKTWFVKMKGNRVVLEKQRENFRSFVGSIQFTE